jgi:hypothetical protein
MLRVPVRVRERERQHGIHEPIEAAEKERVENHRVPVAVAEKKNRIENDRAKPQREHRRYVLFERSLRGTHFHHQDDERRAYYEGGDKERQFQKNQFVPSVYISSNAATETGFE